jgi:hypothetical protein
MTRPLSNASRSEKGVVSSAICPASTLERSRKSLISGSRWYAEAVRREEDRRAEIASQKS